MRTHTHSGSSEREIDVKRSSSSTAGCHHNSNKLRPAMGSACSGPPKAFLNPYLASDFTVGDFVAEGGIAKVYSGHEVGSGTKVALKFFGYLPGVVPTTTEIEAEMEALREVLGVNGLVQFRGKEVVYE